LQYKQNMNRSR